MAARATAFAAAKTLAFKTRKNGITGETQIHDYRKLTSLVNSKPLNLSDTPDKNRENAPKHATNL